MEEELNYLSNKIEKLQAQVDTRESGLYKLTGMGKAYVQSAIDKDKAEINLLDNILNVLTHQQLEYGE